MKYSNLNLIELKDRKNKWQAICEYKDTEGKRKFKRKSMPTESKREAWKLAEAWFNEINIAASAEEVKEEDTVEEVILEYIEKQRDKHLIEESTYFQQKKRIKCYIHKYPIATLGFYSLERQDIEDWITQQFNKGLAPGTIRGSFNILNKTYNEYVRLDKIIKNPCDAVKAPTSKPVKTYMTDNQMTDLLQKIWLNYDNSRRRHVLIACLLAYYCGLRRQEIVALRYRDIDFERKMITISSAAALSENGQYLKDPKNRTSFRSFPIPDQLLEVLKRRYQEVKPEDSDFVCARIKNKPMDLSVLSMYFRELVVENDLKDAYGKSLSLHKLRHNVGYGAIRNGVDAGALSKILGHSNIATTLNVYSDTSPDAVKVGMEKITEFFKKRDLDE